MRTGPDFREEHFLRDGTKVVLRHIQPVDADELLRGFEKLSPESRFFRFFHGVSRLSPEQLRYLTEVDGRDHVAIVAVTADGTEQGLGVARFIRDKDEPTVAEAAITVIDAMQGKGLGTILGAATARAAKERGIERFRGEILTSNQRMRELLSTAGARVSETGDGEARFDVELSDLPLEEEARTAFIRNFLRSIMRMLVAPVAGTQRDG